MEFRLLGPVELMHDGAVVDLGPRKRRAVLAVLLLELNHVVPFDRLIDLIWDGEPTAAARSVIFAHVSQLRSGLRRAGISAHEVDIQTTDSGYVLQADPDVVDLYRFSRLADQATRRADLRGRVAGLRSALGIWRGEAMTDLAEPLRQRLAVGVESQRLRALEALMAAELELGRSDEIVAELTDLVATYPTREGFLRSLMLALYRSGDQVRALEVYTDARKLISEEYGLDVGPELRSLELAILRHDPAIFAPVVPEPGPAPRQLPPPVRAFVGRTAELATLDAALDGDGTGRSMLVAVTGMAGVGKTAFAVRAAHRHAHRFPDGQIFIDMHGFTEGVGPTDASGALSQVLFHLGIPAEHIPPSLDLQIALYRECTAARNLIVVLDNVASEAQITPLIPTGACMLIVTSRRVLAGLDDALPIALDILSVTEAADMIRATVGILRRVPGDDEAMADIANMCGCLPLALRLTASRLLHRQSWTMQYLASRMREEQSMLDGPRAGERSVASAFELSFQTITDIQAMLLFGISLSPCGQLDAGAAAAAGGTTERDARPLLDALVDVHLIEERTPGRYGMHDLVRSYTRGRAVQTLSSEAVDASFDRLIMFFVYGLAAARVLCFPQNKSRRLNEAAADSTFPAFPDRDSAYVWWTAEYHNLVSVALAATTRARLPLRRALAEGMFALLEHDGHARDGLRLASTLADLLHEHDDHAGEVVALRTSSVFADYLGDTRGALAYVRRAYAVVTAVGQAIMTASVLINLADMTSKAGEPREAQRMLTDALEIVESADNADHRIYGSEYCLRILSTVQWALGDTAQAISCAERAAALSAGGANDMTLASCHLLIGTYLRHEGRYREAREHFAAADRIWAQAPDILEEIRKAVQLGATEAAEGEPERAADILHEALDRARRNHDPAIEFDALLELGIVARQLTDLAVARQHHENALEIAVRLEQPRVVIRGRLELANTLWTDGQATAARALWNETLAEYGDTGIGEITAVRQALANSES